MAVTDSPASPAVAPSVTARDPRVAAAVEAAEATSFACLESSWCELPVPAVVRILEDLQVTEAARVLVVEPVSGYLPFLLGRLAFDVEVVVSDVSRAEVLRRTLMGARARNVRVVTFVEDRDESGYGFDRVLVAQPANEELGPVLFGQLAPRGRAVWAVERSMPTRRVRRLMRVSADEVVEEDLDLVHYMPLLGDLLVDAGVALEQEVAEAVRSSKENGRRLGEELLANGSVREVDLYRVLAEQRRMPFALAKDLLERIDQDLVEQLPRQFMNYYRFVPVRAVDGKVWVATPDTELPVDELRAVFDGAEIGRELVCPTDLERIWSFLDLELLGKAARSSGTGGGEVTAAAADAVAPEVCAPAGDVLGEVLSRAIERGATAVHIDVRGDVVELRLRVAGTLQPVAEGVTAAQVSGVVAALEAAPGSLWSIDGRLVDVTCADLPTITGRAVTIGLSELRDQAPALAELGFDEEVVAGLRAVMAEPRGLLLVAGPRGSGRSTTMQSALQAVADGSNRVVACGERPVAAGGHVVFSPFSSDDDEDRDEACARRVRALVDQDVDVIGVDVDAGARTLAAIVRAAHDGKLVVATSSGNDAAGALQQLIEHGATGNALATNVQAVVVQHMARRLCPSCRFEVPADDPQVTEVFPDGAPSGFVVHDASGCESCRGTGVAGMLPLVEFLPNSPALRRALRRGVAPHDLGSIARQNGQRSLLDCAMARVASGDVSLRELRRVVSAERRAEGDEKGGVLGRCS